MVLEVIPVLPPDLRSSATSVARSSNLDPNNLAGSI
jgi:DNA-directed RNA polymerase beta' subunit